jgi:hypothetical protein
MSEDTRVTSGLASFTPHDVKVPQEPKVEAPPAQPAALPENAPIPDEVRIAALAAAHERKKPNGKWRKGPAKIKSMPNAHGLVQSRPARTRSQPRYIGLTIGYRI